MIPSNWFLYDGMRDSQAVFTCSKLTIESLEQGVNYCRYSGVFIVNFEHISQLVLVFILLTLNM